VLPLCVKMEDFVHELTSDVYVLQDGQALFVNFHHLGTSVDQDIQGVITMEIVIFLHKIVFVLQDFMEYTAK